MKRNSITIHPVPESLAWDAGGNPPVPGLVIECGPHTRSLDIEIELASDTETFVRGSAGRFALGLRLERGKNFTWHLPPPVWERLAVHPRIFYRAAGRLPSGRTVYSLDEALTGDLPFFHGRPSAVFYKPSLPLAQLPPLGVAGSTLRREGDAMPFILRGVNVSGLNHARYFYGPTGPDTDSDPAACRSRRWRVAAHVTPELLDRLKEMRVNLIRLPLNQDWTLMGYHEPELPEFAQSRMDEYTRYLEDMDQIIAWAAERGIYVMLSLHTLRLCTPRGKQEGKECEKHGESFGRRMCIESEKQPYNAHLPDHRSWLFWSVLAQRYRQCSAVLFDLCNEPHEVNPLYWDSAEYRGILPSPPSLRAAVDRGAYMSWWVAEWKRLAGALEGLVHRVNKDALVFISGFGGPCWSASLEQMQIIGHDNNPNIILSVHWYWSRSLGPETWRRYLGLDQAAAESIHHTRTFPRHPIFVKEWGVETPEAITQESALQPLSREYKKHWHRRFMPEHAVLVEWARRLVEFFIEMADREDGKSGPGFAGFAAWSTGDKPRIFEREGVYAGPYKRGFPLTDYGKIVEGAVAWLAEIAEGRHRDGAV